MCEVSVLRMQVQLNSICIFLVNDAAWRWRHKRSKHVDNFRTTAINKNYGPNIHCVRRLFFINTALLWIQFSQRGISNHISVYYFYTGFEVRIVARIHNTVWVMMPQSVIHGYECSGGAFCVHLQRSSEDGGSMSRPIS